jgi:hypothetical protein
MLPESAASEATVRTTVDIEDGLLLAIEELAQQHGVSISNILSDLVRQALTRPAGGDTRNGVPLFPVSTTGDLVTLELVNRLRDELP